MAAAGVSAGFRTGTGGAAGAGGAGVGVGGSAGFGASAEREGELAPPFSTGFGSGELGSRGLGVGGGGAGGALATSFGSLGWSGGGGVGRSFGVGAGVVSGAFPAWAGLTCFGFSAGFGTGFAVCSICLARGFSAAFGVRRVFAGHFSLKDLQKSSPISSSALATGFSAGDCWPALAGDRPAGAPAQNMIDNTAIAMRLQRSPSINAVCVCRAVSAVLAPIGNVSRHVSVCSGTRLSLCCRSQSESHFQATLLHDFCPRGIG